MHIEADNRTLPTVDVRLEFAEADQLRAMLAVKVPELSSSDALTVVFDAESSVLLVIPEPS